MDIPENEKLSNEEYIAVRKKADSNYFKKNDPFRTALKKLGFILVLKSDELMTTNQTNNS